MRNFLHVAQTASKQSGGEYIDIAEIAAFNKSSIWLKNGLEFSCDINLYNCLVEIFQNNPVEETRVIKTSCVILHGYEIDCEYINGVKKPWGKSKDSLGPLMEADPMPGDVPVDTSNME